MKKKDHMPAAGCTSRISLGMVMFIIFFMFCTVALYPVDIAEAVTYNMQSGTGDLNGITANYGTCATNATAPVIVPMNTSGSNACTSGRSASTGNVGDQILLIISDTPYSQAMNITGIDVTGSLRDYQETSNPGAIVGIQYQLGYVLSGAFTSFGSADEARDYSTQANWTTDLSGISGTAPSGSSLAIQVLKQNPSGTQYRYYFTSTSVVLNVTETAASSTPPSEVGGSLATSPQYNNGPTFYVPNSVTITENFTSTPAVNACQYTLNNGGAWTDGLVSGAGPYTCTASNINPGSGNLTIGMRASNDSGSTWSTLSATLSRTVDSNGPTDGTLTATAASSSQIDLSWTTASDSGSGLVSTNTYKVVRATGATPPSDCTGSAIYTGTGLSFNDNSGLSPSTQYSYRVCGYDNLSNESTGAIASATTQAGGVPAVPAGNLSLFIMVTGGIAAYGLVWRRKQVKVTF